MVYGGYIYIMTNSSRSTLYIGVTANLFRRVNQHAGGDGSIFTKKYKCNYLIHFEFHPTIIEAIKREKQIKKWKRVYKDNLIRKGNPNMRSLNDEIENYQ